MREFNMEQGSDEWFAKKLGILSASNFSKVCTTSGKPSSSADAYIDELIQERVTGKRIEGFVNDAMLRGAELEPEARNHFSFMTDIKVREVGWCVHDDIQAGCSPDGLIVGSPNRMKRGEGLEIKCPLWKTHCGWLRKGKLPTQHKLQVQGSLFITGYERWHFYSYHPDFDEQLHIVVERDEKIITALEKYLIQAAKEIKLMTERLSYDNGIALIRDMRREEDFNE